jgi:predicted  nucleic acid-binding Zn-ribbon protein
MSSHPFEQDSPHICVNCETVYAEYVNGCPKCWEHGVRAKTVAVKTHSEGDKQP